MMTRGFGTHSFVSATWGWFWLNVFHGEYTFTIKESRSGMYDWYVVWPKEEA